MRSGAKSISVSGVWLPAIPASRVVTAARAMAVTGWRTVVRGGAVMGMRGESS